MKNRNLLGWLRLGALAALLAGCTLPPYDEDVSLAAKTTPKLRLENEIGPLYVWLDEWPENTEFYFLPSRNDPQNGGGFFVIAADYGLRVHYLDDAAMGFGANWGIQLDDQPVTANRYLLEPIESASNYYLILARAPQNDLKVILATSPASIGIASEYSFSDLFTATVVGSNIYPDSTAGADLQYFLCNSGSATEPYIEVECHTSTVTGATIDIAGPPSDLGLVPDTLTNAFYYHNPGTDKSYLSYWSSSAREYRSYSWTTNSFLAAPTDIQQLTGIDGRIDALLTSGQLLSFNKGACTVYSAAGQRQFRFPLGGLSFCYERHDGAEYRLYFSQAYLYYGYNDNSDRLFIEVYSIPTADLGSLK